MTDPLVPCPRAPDREPMDCFDVGCYLCEGKGLVTEVTSAAFRLGGIYAVFDLRGYGPHGSPWNSELER